MKKILAQILLLTWCIGFVSCGSGETEETQETKASEATTQESPEAADQVDQMETTVAPAVSEEAMAKLLEAALGRAEEEPSVAKSTVTNVSSPTSWSSDLQHSSPSNLLTEVIAGHNRYTRTHRENIVFVGHGGRGVEYYKTWATKIIDFDGEGISNGERQVYGIFGQDVYKGSQNKFNFWVVDADAAGVAKARTEKSMCSQESNFTETELDLFAKDPLRNVTYVHMLSDTDCRPQAIWFRFNTQANFLDVLKEAFSSSRLADNIEAFFFDGKNIVDVIADSFRWNQAFSRVIDLENHPSVYLNIYDKGRTRPRAGFAEVAVHELGHAWPHFLDEYHELNNADVRNFESLYEALRIRIDLSKIVPDWVNDIIDLPVIRINPLARLLNELDFIGPNCAPSAVKAIQRWGGLWMQGSGDQKILSTPGCLYSSSVFYRSSKNSKMKSASAPFNPYQERYIREHYLSQRSDR